ncbi:MAG: hypothetical protein ABJI60_16580 [Kangiellaceae bacterium]
MTELNIEILAEKKLAQRYHCVARIASQMLLETMIKGLQKPHISVFSEWSDVKVCSPNSAIKPRLTRSYSKVLDDASKIT